MARRYRVGPGETSFHPPADAAAQVSTRGLGPRHWALLGLLAEHGALHTAQVTTLLFDSRPAAVRHLGMLTRAGLVWRFVHDNDPTHTAFYEASGQGLTALARRLSAAEQTVPARLGTTGRDMFEVNDMFTRLAGDPAGHLYRCWTALRMSM